MTCRHAAFDAWYQGNRPDVTGQLHDLWLCRCRGCGRVWRTAGYLPAIAGYRPGAEP